MPRMTDWRAPGAYAVMLWVQHLLAADDASVRRSFIKFMRANYPRQWAAWATAAEKDEEDEELVVMAVLALQDYFSDGFHAVEARREAVEEAKGHLDNDRPNGDN